jgi:hypothetical protein
MNALGEEHATSASDRPVDRPRETDLHRRWGRARRLGLDFWYPVIVVAVALVLSACAISGSSLALWSTTEDPDTSAVIAGELRAVRSDEWQVTSPIKVGQVEGGFPSERTFGLGRIEVDNSWRPQVPNRSLGAALYSPFNLPLALLPIEQGFALYWWLPFVACALALYAWLRLVGVGRRVAFAASLVTTVAPASVWWSGWVCQAIAQAVVPCVLLIAATRLWERRRRIAVMTAVVAGLSAAGLPWFYQPFSVPAGLSIGLLTLIWGVSNRTRRRPFLLLGAIAGTLFAVESAIYLLHERAYYEALGSTVYPGARREQGGGVGIGEMFSSLFPDLLARNVRQGLKSGNLSEISMGWTITAPIALLLGILGFPAIRRDRDRALLLGSLGVTLLIGTWCFVRLGSLFGTLTLLTFSPGQRSAPFVGFVGTISLALLLGTPDRRARLHASLGRPGIAALAIMTMVVAAWGAVEFRRQILEVSIAHAVFVVALIGIVVVLAWTRWQRVAIAGAVAVAVLSGVVVNPVMRGLGAIVSSRPASQVVGIDRRVVDPAHGNWAADSLAASALLNGQGVNSLSSYNDPVDAKAWRTLDPHRVYESQWNRLGYINFTWQPGLRDPVIETSEADVVNVRIDPCDARLSRLHLVAILASEPLEASCLRALDTVRWHGQTLTAYQVIGS